MHTHQFAPQCSVDMLAAALLFSMADHELVLGAVARTGSSTGLPQPVSRGDEDEGEGGDALEDMHTVPSSSKGSLAKPKSQPSTHAAEDDGDLDAEEDAHPVVDAHKGGAMVYGVGVKPVPQRETAKAEVIPLPWASTSATPCPTHTDSFMARMHAGPAYAQVLGCLHNPSLVHRTTTSAGGGGIIMHGLSNAQMDGFEVAPVKRPAGARLDDDDDDVPAKAASKLTQDAAMVAKEDSAGAEPPRRTLRKTLADLITPSDELINQLKWAPCPVVFVSSMKIAEGECQHGSFAATSRHTLFGVFHVAGLEVWQ